MGLERMTAVLQNTHDNYNIDHFKKIIGTSAEILKSPINDKTIEPKIWNFTSFNSCMLFLKICEK